MLGGDDTGAVAVDVVAILCVVGAVDDSVRGRLVVAPVFVVSLSDVTTVEKLDHVVYSNGKGGKAYSARYC